MGNRKYFLSIIILFIILLLTFFMGDTNMWDFVFISISLFIGYISYNIGSKHGLMLGMFSSLIYGSILLYLALTNYIITSDISYYAWIILLPASAVIFGLYGDYIRNILEKKQRFEKYAKEAVYKDPLTDLPTRGEFYKNFAVESKLMEKQKFALTLMLLKLDYNDELRDILGFEEYKNLIKDSINKVEEVIGVNNREYILDGERMMIFLNYVTKPEADEYKTKILKSFDEFTLSLKRNKNFKLKLRIVVKEYNGESDIMDFENSMVKDLEYEN